MKKEKEKRREAKIERLVLYAYNNKKEFRFDS